MVIAIGIGGVCKSMEEVGVLWSSGLVCYSIVFGSFQITKNPFQHAYVLHAGVGCVGC